MKTTAPKWTFPPRFRRHAFGWRSQTPIKRIKEAVSEIKKVARKEPVIAAEGAILFLEKVSAAIEHVDSSSGAIGTAVNNAIDTLSPIIAAAPTDNCLRQEWLDRLWQAVQNDDIPYLDLLPEYWGELCATPELASRWADELIATVRLMWDSDRASGGWFKGTPACLSALYKAGRYDELLDLIAIAPYDSWGFRIWGAKALSAQGKNGEAIQYAESTRDSYANPVSMAQTCEEILLSDGLVQEAYSRYALAANRKTTNLATFHAVAAKYPQKAKTDILRDLAAQTPEEAGKWFAAAKSVGLYEQAIELADRTPCDPKTLTRAARDMASTNSRFAMKAGLAALRWLIAGYGYNITSMDVSAAYRYTMKAAANAGCVPAATTRLLELLENPVTDDAFAAGILPGLMKYGPAFWENSE